MNKPAESRGLKMLDLVLQQTKSDEANKGNKN